MHPVIFQEFEQICSRHGPFERVLEIGVTRNDQPLLVLPSLRKAKLKIGIDQAEGFLGDDYIVMKADANGLGFFADRSFDLVLCNSVLEHDPSFWLTVREMGRVARAGALLIFGVPGFGAMGAQPGLKILRRMVRLPWIGRRWEKELAACEAATPTLGLHDYPVDYYRFSEQAMREVILQGLLRVQVKLVMNPPRVLGWGFVPG